MSPPRSFLDAQPSLFLLLAKPSARPFPSIPTREVCGIIPTHHFPLLSVKHVPYGFVASVQSEECDCLFSLVSNIKFGTSRLERRSGRDDAVLLLHELLAGSLDGDGKTELGGVL